ncbi:MAG: hypothetical protein ACOX81_03045 [Candidatus Heteroscillospira sp.]|jgi:hypothetical protein
MPYQFENRYRLTDEMLLEYVKRRNSRSLFMGSLMFSGINALLGILLFYLHKSAWAAVLCFFAAVGLASGLSIPVFFLCRRRFPLSSAPVRETVVRFGEQIYYREGGRWETIDYRSLTGIRICRTFFALDMGRQAPILLSPNGFSNGDSTPFWHFLREKRPDLKVKTVNLFTRKGALRR